MSLAEAKRHIGLSDNEHDYDIDAMIDAACHYLTRRTGRAVVDTTLQLSLSSDEWCTGSRERVVLPYPPLRSVTYVKYYDTTGADTTLTGYQIATSDIDAYLVPAVGTQWPAVQQDRVDAVRIEYVVGPATDALPEAKRAALLLVRHYFDNPSAVITGQPSSRVEMAVDSLVRSMGVGRYANV